MEVSIEIKAGETLDRSLFSGLKYFLGLGPPVATTGVLVHGGDALWRQEQFVVRPWHRCV